MPLTPILFQHRTTTLTLLLDYLRRHAEGTTTVNAARGLKTPVAEVRSAIQALAQAGAVELRGDRRWYAREVQP
jgi:DNA-binding IclR family transcriptional regulator